MTSTPQPYRAFTTAHDRVVHARNIMETLGDEARAQMATFMDQWSPEPTSVAPAEDARPTRFLMDLSGSMRGFFVMAMLTAMRAEGDRLHAAGTPFEILGFTTRTWKGGQSRADWVEAGRPQAPGRLSDLMHVVVKGMDEDWADCRDHLGALLKEGTLKENVDGEALEWALARAAEDNTPSGLVMLTDGAPHCDSTVSVNPVNLLQDHFEEVLERISDEDVPFQRIRMDVNVRARGQSLREDIDIPAHRDEIVFWGQCMQKCLSAKAILGDETLPLRMGVGEPVPMNPLCDALSEAVAETSNSIAAKYEPEEDLTC